MPPACIHRLSGGSPITQLIEGVGFSMACPVRDDRGGLGRKGILLVGMSFTQTKRMRVRLLLAQWMWGPKVGAYVCKHIHFGREMGALEVQPPGMFSKSRGVGCLGGRQPLQ